MNTPHFAVVGAGIIGICCGLKLQEKGYKVSFFDPRGFGGGCSKGNAGHFATEQVFPLADPALLWQLPKMLLDPLGPIALSPSYFTKALPWFLRFMFNMRSSAINKNSTALKALNSVAIEEYQSLLQSINAEHLLTLKGSLLVYETTDLSVVEKDLAKYQAAGVAVTLLNKAEVQALEPDIADSVNYALYFTEVGHTIDPYDLCLALAAVCLERGANLNESEVLDINEQDQQVTITTKDNKQHFDGVILANGAWSKSLVNKLGYKLPIETERGYHLMMENCQMLSRPVASAERKFIMTPMAKGLRLAGTVEFAGLEKAPNYARADLMQNHATALLKQFPTKAPDEFNESERWLGFRPSLPDSLPVIDKAPAHNAIYFALGHQHLGLTWGAITGKLMAQLICRETTDLNLTPYEISRFN